MHYDKPVISKELQHLVAYSKKHSFQLILSADSNSHSDMWGPTPKKKCKRGELLEQWILQESLVIHNQGEAATFENKRCKSSIDITLSLNLSTEITNWAVSEEYNGSDHKTISADLIITPQPLEPVWNWNKAEWPKFKELLEKAYIRIPQKLNERRVEYILGKIYGHIYKAMEKTIPKITPSGKQKCDKWFDEKLHNTRNKVNHLKRKYKSCLLYTSPSPRD